MGQKVIELDMGWTPVSGAPMPFLVQNEHDAVVVFVGQDRPGGDRRGLGYYAISEVMESEWLQEIDAQNQRPDDDHRPGRGQGSAALVVAPTVTVASELSEAPRHVEQCARMACDASGRSVRSGQRELRADLQIWSDSMTALHWGKHGPDDRRSGGLPRGQLERLSQAGLALARRVRREVGYEWAVTYHDELTHDEISVGPS